VCDSARHVHAVVVAKHDQWEEKLDGNNENGRQTESEQAKAGLTIRQKEDGAGQKECHPASVEDCESIKQNLTYSIRTL